MGINNFFKWMHKSYPSDILPITQNFYDHVYIDINVILHRIIRSSPDEETLFGKLFSYIDNILKFVIPMKTLTLAIDGIASFAKIMLQRERRLNYVRANKNNISEINPLCFTPGTYFMNSLSEKMSDYFYKIKNIYKINLIDLFDGPGEAELKIINQLLYHNLSNDSLISESHCIYSCDADVVVIACSIDCFDRLTNNNDNNTCTYKNQIFIHNTNNLININDMMKQQSKYLIKNLSHKHILENNLANINLNKVGRDFSFVSQLMGNDYLPKLLYVTFEKLWISYFDAFTSINTIKNHNTTIDNLIFLMNDDFTINIKFITTLLRNIISNLSKQYINSLSFNDCNKYYDYVYGLCWCFKTYNKGFCNKLDYIFPSSYAIHPLGLLIYIESSDMNSIIKNIYVDIDKIYDYKIDKEIYATLILPHFGKKYIEYIKEINFENQEVKNITKILYDVEHCILCDEFHKKLGKLNLEHKSTLSKNTIVDANFNAQKKQITDELQNFRLHSITHKNILINDIIEIINTLKKHQSPLINKKVKIISKNIQILQFKPKKRNYVYLF